jgi:hypothetical protein
MQDNVVSLTGEPVVAGDPVREDFLAFAAGSYDQFKSSSASPTAFILTMVSDEGCYNTYWLGHHCLLPAPAFLSIGITGLTAAFVKGETGYQPEAEDVD